MAAEKIPWGEGTRIFEVPAGDSFGVFVVHFLPEQGDGTLFGVAANRDDLPHEAFVRAYAFTLVNGSARLGASSGGIGGGAFGLGSGDDTTSPTTLFVFVIHTERAGQLKIANWFGKGSDRSLTFPEPRFSASWEASGQAQVSYYEESNGASASFNTEVRRLAGPANPAALGGEIDLRAGHTNSTGITISTAIVASLGGALGTMNLTWSNGTETHQSDGPIIATPTKAGAGYRIVGEVTGESTIDVSWRGGATIPSFVFQLVTLPFNPHSLGYELSPRYEFDRAIPAPLLGLPRET